MICLAMAVARFSAISSRRAALHLAERSAGESHGWSELLDDDRRERAQPDGGGGGGDKYGNPPTSNLFSVSII